MAYGSIAGQTSSDRRVCRLVVGTSSSGWTSADCDYLCDGTDDQVEINAAIQALPSTGGEVVILDGTYNITATIAMNKANVKLSGNGNATVLKRMWNSSSLEGVINLSFDSCAVESLLINSGTSSSGANDLCIYLNGSNYNTITGNICRNNSGGIYLSGSSSSDSNTITGNTCNNTGTGIYLEGGNCSTITGNTCCNNSGYGIYLSSNNNDTITGNTCHSNAFGIYMNDSDNNTVTGNTCYDNTRYGIYLFGPNNNNTITGNTCNYSTRGKYIANGSTNAITGNTCYNNTQEGMYIKGSDQTVTGNTCNDNGSNHPGIYLYSDNSTATGNTCNNNNIGIYLSGKNSTITGNTCHNNGTGIYMNRVSVNNTVMGNTCIRNDGASSDYTASQKTIDCAGDNNLIVGNNIMGKNYTDSGTGNTFEGNKYN